MITLDTVVAARMVSLMQTATYTFHFEGMNDQGDADELQNALEGSEGVRRAEVKDGYAEVHSGDVDAHDRFAAVIRAHGYTITGSSSSSRSAS